jgi:serine/threonine protein phosphatase 1
MTWRPGRAARLEKAMRLGQARTPDDLRLYAIGDVHGCDDLIAEAHAKIADDLASRPVADYRIVHCGDYVDRGPDSAGVVERLVRRQADDSRAIFLRGNHEEFLLAFLPAPERVGETWLINGAAETLASYGVLVGDYADFTALGEAFAASLPKSHLHFLDRTTLSVSFGDYFFCHAGVRPGVALDRQRPDDLIWIREGFLDSNADFGKVVIHGHTPVAEPEILPNRIDIDTGAVFTGRLTCLVLEGSGYRFL